MGMFLDWFRRAARGTSQRVDRRALLGILGLLFLGAVILSIPVQRNPTNLKVLQVTLDAASTQANIQYPTLSARLTETPIEAVMTQAAPTLSLEGLLEVRQFAAAARADSERDKLNWGAVQAAGPPNTPQCGDFRTAWATAQPNGQGTLTLFYAQLVRPTGVLIYETYNPGFITRIALIDIDGNEHVIYEAPPGPSFQCPFTHVVLAENADYATNTVVITLDQSTSTGGWDQIDAVELIGIKYN